ncbi:MAG: tripartite tricarboxylate transporter substrate binding protein, partial [Betaproteobacteria bacterium]|nr:tripartite tricarboxylate transporter substrate binding protein [Betaproteobacteria bacterium]
LAQRYPSKPIRLIVPFPPGGGNDILARIIAPKLTESLGQQIVIDNRPGATGTIGSELAARSAPDGYTLLMVTSSTIAVNPSLSKLPYDPLNDFAPVTQLAGYQLILVVNPSVPAKSVKELIALAKSKPGQLNYASPGSGTSMHLAGELFNAMAGVDMVHIPYKGSVPGMTDMLGGRVQIGFNTMLSTMPYVKAGKLRALALTSAERSPALPDLPTVAEAGVPGYEATSWYGIVAPARTPKEIITELNTELVKILKMPDIREKLSSQGVEPVTNTPEQFAAYIKAEIAKWAKVIKDRNVSKPVER